MKDIMFLLHDGEKRRGGVETLLSQCQYQKGTNRPTVTLKKTETKIKEINELRVFV